MLTIDNGFTRFMSKLDGKSTTKTKSKWSTRELLSVDVMDKSSLEAAIDGYFRALLEAFVWRTTPQGHDYWASRHDRLVEMNDQDYLFLDALYRAHYG